MEDPPPFRALTLVRNDGGGFRLEGPKGWLLEASPAPGGWTIQRSRSGRHWILKRTAESTGRGFVLQEEEGGEVQDGARTTHATGMGHAPGAVSLLLSDGRLFWILPSGGPEPGFELAGWEVPGGYWRAHRGDGGWSLAPTVAGLELGVVEELLVLIAAEVLDAEVVT